MPSITAVSLASFMCKSPIACHLPGESGLAYLKHHPLPYRDNPAFCLSSGPTVVQQALISYWVFFRSLDEAPVFMELTIGCTSHLVLGFFRMLALPDCLLPPLLLRKVLLFPLRFGIGLTSSRRYSLNTISGLLGLQKSFSLEDICRVF